MKSVTCDNICDVDRLLVKHRVHLDTVSSIKLCDRFARVTLDYLMTLT